MRNNRQLSNNSNRIDDEIDFLMELTTHPGWKILRREAERYVGSYDSIITRPAEKEFDMVRKEAAIAARTGLLQFFRSVEERVEQYARQLHTSRA